MAFTTTGTERMRIDNAGEVMIGSNSSDGVHKLKVIGSCFLVLLFQVLPQSLQVGL